MNRHDRKTAEREWRKTDNSRTPVAWRKARRHRSTRRGWLCRLLIALAL